ncbi:hypothetical protein NFI96_013225 [Prochilodus magdalenae]|nr:hypothetical protein NFI96_013225 [Prochilodus magdalenae]
MFLKVVVLLMAICFAVASAGPEAPGAPMHADISEKDVRVALRFAVGQYNQAGNDKYIRKVSRIIRAQKQVVEGVKYIFTVEMSRTICEKGGAEGVCPIISDPKRAKARVCKFEVWSRPWLNSIKLVENTCM